MNCLLPRIAAPTSCVLAATLVCSAATVTETYTFAGLKMAVADGSKAGMTNTQSVSSSITSIQSIEVSVDITGTFNGDLYAYLAHGSDLAVLLNRPGRSAAETFGYGDDGLSVTFTDAAAHNIHTYQDEVMPNVGSPLTGEWQPDGRMADPENVLTSDPVVAQLAVFNSLAADGDWTLFIADLASGDEQMLEGWSIEITGVPEPGSTTLLVLGISLLTWRRQRGADRPGILQLGESSNC